MPLYSSLCRRHYLKMRMWETRLTLEPAGVAAEGRQLLLKNRPVVPLRLRNYEVDTRGPLWYQRTQGGQDRPSPIIRRSETSLICFSAVPLRPKWW